MIVFVLTSEAIKTSTYHTQGKVLQGQLTKNLLARAYLKAYSTKKDSFSSSRK